MFTACHVCGRRRVRGGRIVSRLDVVDRALGVRIVCRGCGIGSSGPSGGPHR